MKARWYTKILLLLTAFAVACDELPLVSNPTDRAGARLEIQVPDGPVYTGDQIPLRWTLFDQNDQPVDVIPAWLTPTWSSSQPIVRISDGRIEPLAPGEATLSFSIGGVTAQKNLRINPGALAAKIEAAYITQGIQRTNGSLPLVAGRAGMLRVFVTANEQNWFRPTIRVRFNSGGSETVLTTGAATTSIPLSVREDALSFSWNIPVPASLITPGTTMLVELQSDGGLRPGPAAVLKYPANGTPLALDIRTVPTFRITFVPIAIVGFATGNVNAGNVDSYMAATRQVWPFSSTDVIVREPYSTTTRSLTGDDWSDLLLEIRQLRTADASSRYYHGILRREGAWAGLGYINFPVAITQDVNSTWTVAHELGHNFGRRHAPCGGPDGVDTSFPYSNGNIGVYGLEADGETMHPPTRADLMSYCSPRWISDYTFSAAVTRLQAPAGTLQLATEPPVIGNMLIVSGEIGSARARINPAFTLETAAALPSQPGPYTLEGYDASGGILFSISFSGESLGDGPESVRQFAFAIPVAEASAKQLALLRVIGGGANLERSLSIQARAAPGAGMSLSPSGSGVEATRSNGEVTLRWDASSHPLIVVINPTSGALVAMARGGKFTFRSDAPELELKLSDGLRSSSVYVSPK